MAEVDTKSEIVIRCGAAEAWAVIADFARNPQWQKGMRSCTWLTEPPAAVGSRYRQEAGFLGRTIHSVFEVVEFDDGHLITIDTIEGTFPITVTRVVEPAGDGQCRVSAHVRGTPTGVMGMLSPLMAPMVKRSVNADYERLKALLEG